MGSRAQGGSGGCGSLFVCLFLVYRLLTPKGYVDYRIPKDKRNRSWPLPKTTTEEILRPHHCAVRIARGMSPPNRNARKTVKTFKFTGPRPRPSHSPKQSIHPFSVLRPPPHLPHWPQLCLPRRALETEDAGAKGGGAMNGEGRRSVGRRVGRVKGGSEGREKRVGK
jgi:hypothetical protein